MLKLTNTLSLSLTRTHTHTHLHAHTFSHPTQSLSLLFLLLSLRGTLGFRLFNCHCLVTGFFSKQVAIPCPPLYVLSLSFSLLLSLSLLLFLSLSLSLSLFLSLSLSTHTISQFLSHSFESQSLKQTLLWNLFFPTGHIRIHSPQTISIQCRCCVGINRADILSSFEPMFSSPSRDRKSGS